MNMRQVEETIARCVSIAVYYHGAERTARAGDLMGAEVRATSLEIKEWGLSTNEARSQIVEPVGRELVKRFGPATGSRLAVAFADAFEGNDPDVGPTVRTRARTGPKRWTAADVGP